jgi:hypothetical protein
MKKLLAIIFLAVILFGIYWMFFKKSSHESGPKQEPLKVGVHSTEFNKSIIAAVFGYTDLKDAFVDADTLKIKARTKKFSLMLDSIKMDELKKDTTGIFQSAQLQVSDMKANVNALLMESDLTEMRKAFRDVSENLYPFLTTIHYEGPKLFWQNCPMAFGEGKEASWISSTKEILNPYLGKNHPEFKGTMLHCGEIKDSIK